MNIYQILHLCRNVEREVSGAAAGAPGDVAEGGSESAHAILSIVQICHTLGGANHVNMTGASGGGASGPDMMYGIKRRTVA